MRGAIPSEESVIVLMTKTAMDKSTYHLALLAVDMDKKLSPEEELNFLDLLNN